MNNPWTELFLNSTSSMELAFDEDKHPRDERGRFGAAQAESDKASKATKEANEKNDEQSHLNASEAHKDAHDAWQAYQRAYPKEARLRGTDTMANLHADRSVKHTAHFQKLVQERMQKEKHEKNKQALHLSNGGNPNHDEHAMQKIKGRTAQVTALEHEAKRRGIKLSNDILQQDAACRGETPKLNHWTEMFLSQGDIKDDDLELAGNPHHDPETGRFSAGEAQDMSEEAEQKSSWARNGVKDNNEAAKLHRKASEAHRSVASDYRKDNDEENAKRHEQQADEHDQKATKHEAKAKQVGERNVKNRGRSSVYRDLGMKRGKYGGYE